MKELFLNISDSEKIQILQMFEAYTREYKKDEKILSSVKSDDIICLVIAGHIQVIKNDFNGNRTIIEDIYENNIFGSITSNIASSEYEIITREKSKIMIIDLNNILTYKNSCEYYNQFLKNLIRVLYNKINEFNNRIDIITNKTIRNKLLAYFKTMSKNSENRVFYLPFSFSELADYLSINRSAMARELKLLKDEGLIETKGRKIKILYYI